MKFQRGSYINGEWVPKPPREPSEMRVKIANWGMGLAVATLAIVALVYYHFEWFLYLVGVVAGAWEAVNPNLNS